MLIHVIDRSSPVYDKQRETVLRELDAIGCRSTPVVELWNKIDGMEDPEEVDRVNYLSSITFMLSCL